MGVWRFPSLFAQPPWRWTALPRTRKEYVTWVHRCRLPLLVTTSWSATLCHPQPPLDQAGRFRLFPHLLHETHCPRCASSAVTVSAGTVVQGQVHHGLT